MAEWLKAHAWKACVRETVPWVRIPLSPPFLRHSSPQYPIVRIYRKATDEFRDFALIPRATRSFSPWVRRRVLPPNYTILLCIPLFESTAKTIGGAIKAVAASPLIAAQTVPFGSRFGGWILRGRPGVTLPALRVAIRLPGGKEWTTRSSASRTIGSICSRTLCYAALYPLGDGPECSLS